MNAGLVLEARVGILPLHLEDDLLEPPEVRGRRREHLGLPPLPLRGVLIHLVEGARPQRRLVAPRPGPDLHDDVLAVVRILGHQERLQTRAELGSLRLGGLGLLPQERRHLGVGLVLGEGARLLRVLQRGAVLAEGDDDLTELGQVLAESAEPVGVPRDVRRRHLALESLVALLDVGEPFRKVHARIIQAWSDDYDAVIGSSPQA